MAQAAERQRPCRRRPHQWNRLQQHLRNLQREHRHVFRDRQHRRPAGGLQPIPATASAMSWGRWWSRQDGSAVIFPGVLCSDACKYELHKPGLWFRGGPQDRPLQCQRRHLVDAGDHAADRVTADRRQLLLQPRRRAGGGIAETATSCLPQARVIRPLCRPTHFFELSFSSPGTITQVGDTADASMQCRRVRAELPGAADRSGSGREPVWQYPNLYAARGQPSGELGAGHHVGSRLRVSLARTYLMSGTQLNGLTEGSYYGDDVQAVSQFPDRARRQQQHSARLLRQDVQPQHKVDRAQRCGADQLHGGQCHRARRQHDVRRGRRYPVGRRCDHRSDHMPRR